jgi:hypothetical protein
MEQYHKQLKQ